MKQRFILLIDFSEQSENLLNFIKNLGVLKADNMMLVHQIVPFLPALTDNQTRKKIIAEEQERALKYLSALVENDFERFNISFRVTDEPIPKFLNSISKPEILDWVFIGLKKSGFLKRYIIGSTAVDVINQTNKVVIGVSHFSDKLINPKNITVAVHPEFNFQTQLLKSFLDTYCNSNTAVNFLSVASKFDNHLSGNIELLKLSKEIAPYQTRIDYIESDNVMQTIVDVIQKNDTSFLVLQQGTRNAYDSLFRFYFTNNFIHDSITSVVILPQ